MARCSCVCGRAPSPGVDHQQEEVDAGRAGHHRAHEALVAGYVDERQPAAVGEIERRIAEVDRDAACLLLGQPVRVLAGERLHERRLAVIDVTRRADSQRHRASIRPSSTRTGSKPPSASSVRHCASFRSRPAGEREHQQVEPLRAVRLVPVGEHRLEDEQTSVRRGGGSNGAQDRSRLLVAPVVEDLRDDVDVAVGHPVEEAALDERDALSERRLVAHRLREVEHDAA